MAWESCESPRLALVTTPGDLESTITPAAARHEFAPLPSEVRACWYDASFHHCFILHQSFVRGRLCRWEAISAVLFMMYEMATSALVQHSAEVSRTTECMNHHRCLYQDLGVPSTFNVSLKVKEALESPPSTGGAQLHITMRLEYAVGLENFPAMKATSFRTRPKPLQKRLRSSEKLPFHRTEAEVHSRLRKLSFCRHQVSG